MQKLIPKGRFDTRFWKQDLKAGFILSFMSIAFGIGIAAISNFPLQAGLVSAVVAMMVMAGYGGSYIIVCGAAAALAPILASSVTTLGLGDMQLGYSRTLAVIICTGPIMYWIIGRKRKAQLFAAIFSHSVTAALLAAIAVILALGRLPAFTGVALETKGVKALYELFVQGRIFESSWPVLTVTLVTFGFLGVLSVFKHRLPSLKSYPPQLWALPLLFLMGWLLPIEVKDRVNIPANLTEFHVWPDFNLVGMWNDGVFWAFIKVILTLAIVDTAETVATVLGIDRLDRYRRQSDVNKVVSAMGIANMVSGFLGGLSNIPGGAKSTMSAAVGTVTAWASIFGVAFIVIEVLLGRQILNVFPQAGLAAVIVFTVGKLCAPAIWRSFWQVGKDQFVVFLTTFGISVMTGDILEGLIAGVLLQFGIVLGLTFWVAGPYAGEKRFLVVMKIIWGLWSNPEVTMKVCSEGKTCDVYFSGVWVFFKDVDRVFRGIPGTVKIVRFYLTDEVLMVDQPTMERLRHYVETREGELHVAVSLRALATHGNATRLARR